MLRSSALNPRTMLALSILTLANFSSWRCDLKKLSHSRSRMRMRIMWLKKWCSHWILSFLKPYIFGKQHKEENVVRECECGYMAEIFFCSFSKSGGKFACVTNEKLVCITIFSLQNDFIFNFCTHKMIKFCMECAKLHNNPFTTKKKLYWNLQNHQLQNDLLKINLLH